VVEMVPLYCHLSHVAVKYHCMSCLLLCNELPQTQQLATVSAYSLWVLWIGSSGAAQLGSGWCSYIKAELGLRSRLLRCHLYGCGREASGLLEGPDSMVAGFPRTSDRQQEGSSSAFHDSFRGCIVTLAAFCGPGMVGGRGLHKEHEARVLGTTGGWQHSHQGPKFLIVLHLNLVHSTCGGSVVNSTAKRDKIDKQRDKETWLNMQCCQGACRVMGPYQ
jgi:hypothetical protein